MEREEVGETWRGLVETRAMACSQSFARVAPSPPTCVCPLMSTHTHTHTHTHKLYMYVYTFECVCVRVYMCASVERTQSVYVCICGEHTISLCVHLWRTHNQSTRFAQGLVFSLSHARAPSLPLCLWLACLLARRILPCFEKGNLVRLRDAMINMAHHQRCVCVCVCVRARGVRAIFSAQSRAGERAP